jgi:hypothetical protein
VRPATETRRLALAEIGDRHFEVVEPGRRYRMTVPGAACTFELVVRVASRGR